MLKRIFFIFLSALIAFPLDLKLDRNDDNNTPVYFNSTPNLQGETQAFEQTINPEEYIIGPGDVFNFNMVSTTRTVSVNLTVSPTGHILIPVIGSIFIDKLSLLNAIDKMKIACLAKYPNADIFINLNKVRQFKVNVSGAIGIHIGRLSATPVHKVSDIFSIVQSHLLSITYSESDGESKEITENGLTELSLRNILLIRNGKNTAIDLLSYFILGSGVQNPYLQAGDRIHFSLMDGIVSINGGVVVQGEYEFILGQRLDSYIKLAGGLTQNSDPNYISITRIENDDDRNEINFSDYESAAKFIIEENDHVFIRKKRDYKRQDIIIVDGEVNFPGIYTFDLGKTAVKDILEKCGGLTEKGDYNQIIINNKLIASTQDVELKRILQIPPENRSTVEKAYIKARNGISKGLISSSSLDFTTSILDFKLSSGDNIYIPERLDYVEVIGAVVHPGRYPFITGDKIENYIELAGGLENNATRKRYIIKASTGQRMPISNKESIERGDVIFIAEKLEYNTWDRFRQVIMVVSQVATTVIVIQNIINK